MWNICIKFLLITISIKNFNLICLQDQIKTGVVSWDNGQQFRDWEQNVLMKFKKDEPESEPEGDDLDLDEVIFAHDPMNEEDEEEEEDEDYGDSNYEYKVKNDDCDNTPPGSQKKPVSCPQCGKTFYNLGTMHRHVKTVHEGIKRKDRDGNDVKPWSLDIKDEDSKEAISSHRKKTKLGKKAKICESCDFLTTSQKKYDKHMFEYHEQTMCHVCGMNFLDWYEYFKHTEGHKEPADPQEKKSTPKKKKKDVEPKACPHCGVVTKWLAAHIRCVHEGRGKEPCPHCGELKHKGKHMRAHIKFQHSAFAPVNCPWCGKYIKDLERHLYTTQCNVPEEDRKVIPTAICEICCKVLKTKKSLKAHMRSVHASSDEMFQCDQCSFKSKYKPNLRMHIKTVHDRRSAKEVCPLCHKTCTNLEKHIEDYHKQENIEKQLEDYHKQENIEKRMEEYHKQAQGHL